VTDFQIANLEAMTMLKPIILWAAGVPIVGVILLKVFGFI
jgi:hypothetical protein